VNAQLAILLLLGGGPGQPPADPPDTKAEAEEAGTGAKKLVGEFVVRLEKSDKKLRLEPEPVLSWTNSLERRFYGNVFVWTHEGRPEVLASVNNVFQTGRKARETELLSLSTGQPVLSHDGGVVWEPSRPGVEWKPLPGAPKPGATAAARLQQMRTLAGQFSVVADYGSKKEQKEELRLLRTPIYRYESGGQGVADGALFAFTKATDPEAILMIEARGKKDEVEWQFAFARLNAYCTLRAVHQDKEVWQVDRLPAKTLSDRKQPYFSLRK
jgi:hypothetical protein